MDEYIFISPHGTEMRARRLDERAMTGSPIEARGVPTPIESRGPWLRSDNVHACAVEILRLAEENAELRDLERRHLVALDGMAKLLRDLEPEG